MSRLRALLLGATGFLGRNARPVLAARYDLVAVGRRDADLREEDAVARLLRDVRPEVVVHLAGPAGGIGAHLRRPADFWRDTLLIDTHVLTAAARGGVQKLVTFIGSCAYPAAAPNPLREEDLWAGYPQPESAPFAAAKRLLTAGAEALRRQYGLRTVMAVPGNVYGPHDNFDLEEAHVAAALLRRFHEAAAAGAPEVVCWGTGRPERDFVYVGDLAACLPFLIERYEDPRPLNIARGEGISIRTLAETCAAVVGFRGRIRWDPARPDGQPCKILDVTRMRALGLACPTPLKAGLTATYRWYRAEGNEGGA